MKLPKITALGIAILFLLIDLGTIYGIIYSFYGQISYQQSALNGMIAAHPTNASLYIQASLINQTVNVIIVVVVLTFLAYISKEPIKLLENALSKKPESDNKNSKK